MIRRSTPEQKAAAQKRAEHMRAVVARKRSEKYQAERDAVRERTAANAREYLDKHVEIRGALAGLDYLDVLNFLWADSYLAGDEGVASYVNYAARALVEARRKVAARQHKHAADLIDEEAALYGPTDTDMQMFAAEGVAKARRAGYGEDFAVDAAIGAYVQANGDAVPSEVGDFMRAEVRAMFEGLKS